MVPVAEGEAMTCSTESTAEKHVAASPDSNPRKLSTFQLWNFIKPRNHGDLGVRARNRLDLVAEKVSARGPPTSRCSRTFPLRICTHIFYES